MPLFDFTCSDCGFHFESLMKPYDPVECPKCKMRGDHIKHISHHKGYEIRGDNSASTKPKATS